MSTADWIIVLLWVYMAWNGYRTGFIMQAVRLVSVFIAYWAAKSYGPAMTLWIQEKGWVSQASIPSVPGLSPGTSLFSSIGFLLVFAIAIFVLQIAGRILDFSMSLPILSMFNRMAGLVLGTVLGVVFLWVGLRLAVVLPIPPLHAALASSTLAQTLLQTQLNIPTYM